MLNRLTHKSDMENFLITENAILQRVNELGRQISCDYRDNDVILICILKGALVFISDLIRNLEIKFDIDFIQISSYGNKTESSGNIKFIRDIVSNIDGRDVLIVDDIIDSGLTLQYIRKYLQSKNPSSIKTCVLLNKPSHRISHFNIDYVGFDIPDEFIVGYGLDFNEQYRGLRYITTLRGPGLKVED